MLALTQLPETGPAAAAPAPAAGGATTAPGARRRAGAAPGRGVVRQLLTNPGFLCVSFVTFQAAFTRTGAIFSVVPLVGVERIGLDAAAIGLAITSGNLLNLATIAGAGVLVDRYGRKPVIIPSCLITACAFAGFAFAPSYPAFVFSAILWGIGSALGGSAAAYAADQAPPGGNGITMGIYRMLSDAGYIIGPALLGVIAAGAGGQTALLTAAALAVASMVPFALLAPETAPAPRPPARPRRARPPGRRRPEEAEEREPREAREAREAEREEPAHHDGDASDSDPPGPSPGSKLRGVVGGRGCTGPTDLGREQAGRLRDRLARQPGLAGAVLYSSTDSAGGGTATIVARARRHRPRAAPRPVQLPDRPGGGRAPPRRVPAPLSAPRPAGGVYRPYEEGTEAWGQLLVRGSAPTCTRSPSPAPGAPRCSSSTTRRCRPP